jgi:hypothetical protein
MASGHPPRFVVRSLADSARMRRNQLLLAGAWAISLVVVGLLAWTSARHAPSSAAPRGNPGVAVASPEIEDLRQQVANLERAALVAGIAAKELKRNLGERDEEISGLRTDLAFYSRLVGANGQRDGLKIQGARTEPVKGSPNAWDVVVTLTQNARRGEVLKGNLTLAVEGIQGALLLQILPAGPGEFYPASRLQADAAADRRQRGRRRSGHQHHSLGGRHPKRRGQQCSAVTGRTSHPRSARRPPA